MSKELLLAAQAVLDRWNSPKWEWHKNDPTADLMRDLRKAIEQPVQPDQEPVYQYQMMNGHWIDQAKESYDYNVKLGQSVVRVLYASPQVAQPVQPADEVNKRLAEQCDRLNEALHAIGDLAHDSSTGPVVPDTLWQIRAMAYSAQEEPHLSVVQMAQPVQPAAPKPKFPFGRIPLKEGAKGPWKSHYPQCKNCNFAYQDMADDCGWACDGVNLFRQRIEPETEKLQPVTPKDTK